MSNWTTSTEKNIITNPMINTTMWIKLEIVLSNNYSNCDNYYNDDYFNNYNNKIIYLPTALASSCGKYGVIKFGLISVNAKIEHSHELKFEGESTFENPNIVRLSHKLKDKLHIPESQIYRFKISDGIITIGPVIGLLLGNQTHRYNPKHMEKYSDRLSIYNQIGGLIYAFSPKSINWKRHIAYGLYYDITSKVWKYGCFPLPEVIYRRNFRSSPKVIKKLIEITGGRLFNSYRFSKYELYDYINQNDELRHYLPPTEKLTGFNHFKNFIIHHSQIIMKPVDLSRGRGICIIENTNNEYKITDYRYKHPIVSIFSDNNSLEGFFYMNRNLFENYILQKYIPLAKIQNAPFDIRIVMQKSMEMTWVCTGIECRVSGGNSHITNISRGGYALHLDDALSRSFDKGFESISQKIEDFCQKFCTYMDEMGEHFSELGIDLAVDIDKNLWLIEANVFPSFKGFKAIDMETYLQIRYTPLQYALMLTSFES